MTIEPVSRAALRQTEPGFTTRCEHCHENVKYVARRRSERVICNVYVDGRWDRVEHYHSECYEEAGRPHGDPVVGKKKVYA